MPGIYEVDFEYGRSCPDGRSIWSIYADVLHDDLCNPNGILHNKIKSDLNISGSSVVKLIINQLNLPPKLCYDCFSCCGKYSRTWSKGILQT